MEPIRSSETSLRTRTTRRHIPENDILHQSFVISFYLGAWELQRLFLLCCYAAGKEHEVQSFNQ
jgi:hypothetical protein